MKYFFAASRSYLMSCHVMSCPVLSCLIWTCPVLYCPALLSDVPPRIVQNILMNVVVLTVLIYSNCLNLSFYMVYRTHKNNDRFISLCGTGIAWSLKTSPSRSLDFRDNSSPLSIDFILSYFVSALL